MAAFPAPDADVARADRQLVLRAATSAYLGRYRGQTRMHTESDLRVFLRWCTDHHLDPFAAVRVDIERYVRWLQDVRCYQPSTVSRRLSVVIGFYRVCVIDGQPGTLGVAEHQRQALGERSRDLVTGDPSANQEGINARQVTNWSRTEMSSGTAAFLSSRWMQ